MKKIKPILITLLVATLVMGAAACGPTEREQEYIDTARAVAEEIPLPTWYCPVHGVVGEWGEIAVELAGYDTASGEPTVKICCWVECPERGSWDKLGCGSAGNEIDRFCLHYVSGEGMSYDEYMKIPLNKLTDETVKKYWR